MKKELKTVPPAYIYAVWDTIEPMLEKGLARSGGEYSAAHLKVWLLQGQQTLLITLIDDVITGALTVEFNNFPNDRVAFISCIGGRAMADKELWAQFEAWAKQNGATCVRGAAFESVARLWRKSFGFENRYITVEKKL